MEGELEKRGRRAGGWKSRFFKLNGATAQLFSKKGSDELKVQGRVMGASEVDAMGSREHCFDVVLDGRPVLHCSADTAGDNDRWLEALQRLCTSVPPEAPHGSPHDMKDKKLGGCETIEDRISAGLNGTRAMKDKVQKVLGRFSVALSMLDTVLKVGAELPIFESLF